MKNLLSGLEIFGFNNLSNLEIYDKNVNKEEKNVSKASKSEVTEDDIVFDKEYTCPVCNNKFKSKTVKVGKVKLISADTDLRPKYHLVDSLKYDAIACYSCGYASLNRFFNQVTPAQTKLIKEQISKDFKEIREHNSIYSYDEAIMRHKLALVNTIVKKGRLSERAYICLKIAWLLRGKAENLETTIDNYNEEIEELKKSEDEFIKNAFEGFESAFSKESFPICGMDENTLTYLVADLARRCGKYKESSRWLSQVLISRNANERLKSKARDLKDLIRDRQ